MTEQDETIVQRCERMESALADLRRDADALTEELADSRADVAEARAEADALAQEVALTRVYREATHMLHEQAHGKTSFRFCQQEPCRDLYYETGDDAPIGPARLTLIGVGR